MRERNQFPMMSNLEKGFFIEGWMTSASALVILHAAMPEQPGDVRSDVISLGKLGSL